RQRVAVDADDPVSAHLLGIDDLVQQTVWQRQGGVGPRRLGHLEAIDLLLALARYVSLERQEHVLEDRLGGWRRAQRLLDGRPEIADDLEQLLLRVGERDQRLAVVEEHSVDRRHLANILSEWRNRRRSA